MTEQVPRPPALRLIVLGLAERASYVRDGNSNLSKWNVIGLKHVVLAHVFPLGLAGWSLGIAIAPGGLDQPITLRLLADDGSELGTLGLAGAVSKADGPPPAPAERRHTVLMPPEAWTTAFVPLGADFPIVVQKPGRYRLVYDNPDAAQELVGVLQFAVVDPPAFTPERIAAIKSDPNAVKAVRAVMGCKKCPTKLTVYAALERSPKQEATGAVWFADAPAEFCCECGSSRHDLAILKRNFHGLLGVATANQSKDLSYVPLYERSALETLLHDFRRVLGDAPDEETLQVFLQEHPVLLHQFPADQLFFKPPVLTFFKADFAVVTPQKELVLIEIEKTSTRLLKKNGDEASDLTHALGQVRNWLQVTDDHRLAVLDALGIDREAVSTVRGVVIAGRDIGYDAKHLRRLKGVDRGRLTFLTYDDLAASVAALITGVGKL